MRVFVLALLLFGLFFLAAFGQERWTDRIVRERDMRRQVASVEESGSSGWSTLVIGQPSGAAPLLDYPARGWASSTMARSQALPLAAESRPRAEVEQSAREFAPDFVYRVQPRDTLGAICEGHYGSSRKVLVDAVAAYNGLSSADAISEGALLYLPDAARH